MEYKKSVEKRKKCPFSRGAGHQDNAHLNAPFSLAELESQLGQCKDSAPGPDDITITMVKKLTYNSRLALLNSLNGLWESQQFPDQWTKEVKIPLLKPGKDPCLPSSYRPISLTSSICKLFERMVNCRLMWFLEKNELLNPLQSGFRKNKSTIDALSQLVCQVERGFEEKKHTTAVFFYLEKAYDSVWRTEILNSLYELGLRGNLPIFIESFLATRKFCVRVGASHSDYMEQKEGLPQGSVLSVTCFAIAINDITNQLGPEVKSTLYVDDFTIFASATNEALSNRVLQNSINRLTSWTKTKGMKFSREKTVCVKFEKRKKGAEPQLTLENQHIQSKDSTLYLGIVLDKRLNWRNHVDHLRARCIPAINLIKHLSHLNWGADRKTLKLLYTALVKSKLDYGAQIYGTSNSGALRRLDPIQNECLRAITGAFRSSPAVSLSAETGILPLEFSRDIAVLKHFFKTQATPNTPTHRALNDSLRRTPHPRMEHINSLKQKYQVEDPKIWTIETPELPMWTRPSVELCHFVEVRKAGHLPEELRSDFIAHLNIHDTTHIYTDGSKTDRNVGFATVFPNKSAGGKLPPEASIYTAELYAIKTALQTILGDAGNGNFTIFSDSQSALLALKSNSSKSPIAEETKNLMHIASEKNVAVDICWVPGHIDVTGNEEADKAAKAVAISGANPASRAIPFTDMKRPIKEAVNRAWFEKWNSLIREGRKLREIKQDTKEWSSSHNNRRRYETLLSRLRIGHTNITHAYLMQGQANPPECERCRQPITVKHLLVECAKFAHIRSKYYQNPTLSDMLAEGKDFSMGKIIAYLTEAELLHKI